MRLFVPALVTSAVVAAAACNTTSPRTPTYCEALASASAGCQPTGCDTVLASACTSLDQVLSPSTLSAAKDCLESGICGVEACLSRAPNGAKAMAAHQQLAA